VAKKDAIRTNLRPEEYWEWRTTITEMEVAKQKLINSQILFKLMQKDTELLVARSQLFNCNQVKLHEELLEKSKAEYTRVKQLLENNLNQTLSGKVIDDVTFEIKEVPSDNQQLT